MGYLRNKRLYLSGAIEYSKGTNWRIEPKKVLSESFGLDIFDPFDDPKQQFVPVLQQARATKDLKKIQAVSRDFVKKDLYLVGCSDILVANIAPNIPTTGTTDEIIFATRICKKPTLLVCEEGVENIPFWFFGCVRLEFMFNSWKELYSYLQEVEDGKHKDNDRWSFVYGLI
jgi:nucleoside 2-deoxyribosyltransferase